MEPSAYNAAFIALNLYVIYVLWKDEGIKHGDFRMGWRGSLVRVYNNQSAHERGDAQGEGQR